MSSQDSRRAKKASRRSGTPGPAQAVPMAHRRPGGPDGGGQRAEPGRAENYFARHRRLHAADVRHLDRGSAIHRGGFFGLCSYVPAEYRPNLRVGTRRPGFAHARGRQDFRAVLRVCGTSHAGQAADQPDLRHRWREAVCIPGDRLDHLLGVPDPGSGHSSAFDQLAAGIERSVRRSLYRDYLSDGVAEGAAAVQEGPGSDRLAEPRDQRKHHGLGAHPAAQHATTRVRQVPGGEYGSEGYRPGDAAAVSPA